MKKLAAVILLIVVAGLVWWGVRSYSAPEKQIKFRTEPVERGDLMNVISASGTVEPEELVNVGAQVTGKIIGAELIFGIVAHIC